MAQTVKATKRGTYPGNRLRLPGEVFEIENKEDFSDRWMEKVGGAEAKEASAAGGEAPSEVQVQNAAEVRQLQQQAALLPEGAEVAPPDPRAAQVPPAPGTAKAQQLADAARGGKRK